MSCKKKRNQKLNVLTDISNSNIQNKLQKLYIAFPVSFDNILEDIVLVHLKTYD